MFERLPMPYYHLLLKEPALLKQLVPLWKQKRERLYPPP